MLSFPGIMSTPRVLLPSEKIDQKIDSLRQSLETISSSFPCMASGPDQHELATLQRRYSELASQSLCLTGERERLLVELTRLENSAAVTMAALTEPEYEPPKGASTPQLIMAAIVAFFFGHLLPLRAGPALT